LKIAVKIVKSFIVLIVVFYVIFGVANAQTILDIFKDRTTGITPENQKRIEIVEKIGSNPSDQSQSKNASQISVTADAKANFKNDWLYYPRLNIEGAVEWNVEMQNANGQMINNLVHIAGTAQPEQNGDMLIAGHSSYYLWAKGNYKDILAPLVSSEQTDSIFIKKDNKLYQYKVADIYQIGASEDLKLNEGGSAKKNLYLMTCVPIGTNLRRLVIRADFERVF